jgi:BED zinc finger
VQEEGENKRSDNNIVCEYCGKEFGSSSEFKLHLEQVHTSSDTLH